MNDDMQQIYGKDTSEDKVFTYLYNYPEKKQLNVRKPMVDNECYRRYKVSLGRRLDCLVIQLQGFQSRIQATILYMD